MTIRDFNPSVRRIDNLIIIFKDKYTVIVTDGRYALVFQRWFDRHHFDYANFWKPFTQALRRRRHLSMADCRSLASKFDISTQSFTGDIGAIIKGIEQDAKCNLF